MYRRRYKAMLTLEATVTVPVLLWVCLLICEMTIFLYDRHVANGAMSVALLEWQNYEECGVDPDTKTLLPLTEELPDIDIEDHVKSAITRQTLRSSVVSIDKKTLGKKEEWTVTLRYRGILPLISDWQYRECIRLSRFRPAADIRRNREIEEGLGGENGS